MMTNAGGKKDGWTGGLVVGRQPCRYVLQLYV